MMIITLRSVVFSAATLFTVLTPAAAAQNRETAPDREPRSPRADGLWTAPRKS